MATRRGRRKRVSLRERVGWLTAREELAETRESASGEAPGAAKAPCGRVPWLALGGEAQSDALYDAKVGVEE